MAEFFAGYDRKEYFKPTCLSREDRDSKGFASYVSWLWLFDRDAFFNLKAEYLIEDTDGDWWENRGYRGSLNLVYPLADTLQLQVSGLAFIQEYVNNHPLVIPADPREDRTYQGSCGINYAFMQNASLVLQYAYTNVDSNIGFYDYDRNLYTAGVEYRF